nr:putative ribonuclease h protein [Quercus suber]
MIVPVSNADTGAYLWFCNMNLEDWLRLKCALNLASTSGISWGRASGGGIIRDSKGDWVSGYARAIGYTTSVAADLWALWDGINLSIDLNLENVIIELDAKLVVDLLMKDERSSNGNEVIIADCKEADVALLASLDATGTLYEHLCSIVSVC